MTREEIRKKILADFNVKVEDKEEYDEWTDEELLATAKVIAKRMGLTEPFATENDKGEWQDGKEM